VVGRGDEQIDVPGSGRHIVGVRPTPQPDLDGMAVADRNTGHLDDAAQRGLAAHGQRDLGLGAGRTAPPRLHLRVGQPTAHAKAILG